MSSPAPSDISQNDTEILKKQRQEMQQRHEEEQQLLAQLEEVVKLCRAERAAQKARREVEAKVTKYVYFPLYSMVFLYSITTIHHFQTPLKSSEKYSIKLPCKF